MYQCPSVFSKKIKHIMLVHDIIPKIFPKYLDNSRKKLYWSLSEKGMKKHYAERDWPRLHRAQMELEKVLGLGEKGQETGGEEAA